MCVFVCVRKVEKKSLYRNTCVCVETFVFVLKHMCLFSILEKTHFCVCLETLVFVLSAYGNRGVKFVFVLFAYRNVKSTGVFVSRNTRVC